MYAQMVFNKVKRKRNFGGCPSLTSTFSYGREGKATKNVERERGSGQPISISLLKEKKKSWGYDGEEPAVRYTRGKGISATTKAAGAGSHKSAEFGGNALEPIKKNMGVG
ncbi:Uncharacterized protein TCM_034997 [Theobroma cacao]|uniref:Uncharacterized protein n=1 Tax=Theobroma cacao TaxID=3641 RepID=A0A061FGF2_THECC|nr:Uncharacterized protein TCM_034997 [Theobroma cacao]